MKRTKQVDPDIPKRNLRPRRIKITFDPTASHVFRSIVLDTPELFQNITNYLTLTDIKALVCVCRKWNSYWTPYIYSKVSVSKYRGSFLYPDFKKYGRYTKDLHVRDTKVANITHILKRTPNIQTLVTSYRILSLDIPLSIATLVPQLRTLHLQFDKLSPSLMSTVATLLNLEELKIEKPHQGTQRGLYFIVHICIDELLNIIKNCTKLRSLTIIRLNLEEEFPENDQVEVQRVDDEGWENSSLSTLNWEGILLGPRVSNIDQLKFPHACIHRLYQHLPNITTLKYSGESNLVDSDWEYIFKNRNRIHTVDFGSLFANRLGSHQQSSYGPIWVIALEQFGNIKSLNINDITTSTDEGIAAIVRNNREIKLITAKNTGFGDKALKELARLPNPNTLTELHLWRCSFTTDYGASLILENCGSLKCLNLSGTAAGTIELFKGTKPWVCTKTLKLFCIDIQPIGYTPPSLHPFSYNIPPTEIIRYSEDKEEIIRNRLHSFTSLILLEIKGQAMSINIIKDLSFAPNLRKAIVEIYYKPVDGSPQNSYEAAVQHSKDLGEQLSLGGITRTGASYTGSTGIFSCWLDLLKNAHTTVRYKMGSYSHTDNL